MLSFTKFKKQLILLVFIFIPFISFTQIYQTANFYGFKLNVQTFNKLLSDISKTKQQQKKWNEAVFKLKPLLNSKNTNYKKVEIRNDTLQLSEKISVKGKVEYNITKFPLKKLVDVTFSFKELVIYTRRKEIVVERYQYKKLNTSQLTLFKKINKEEGEKLMELFQQFITLNKTVNLSN